MRMNYYSIPEILSLRLLTPQSREYCQSYLMWTAPAEKRFVCVYVNCAASRHTLLSRYWTMSALWAQQFSVSIFRAQSNHFKFSHYNSCSKKSWLHSWFFLICSAKFQCIYMRLHLHHEFIHSRSYETCMVWSEVTLSHVWCISTSALYEKRYIFSVIWEKIYLEFNCSIQ